jgi:hypothetical protein
MVDQAGPTGSEFCMALAASVMPVSEPIPMSTPPAASSRPCRAAKAPTDITSAARATATQAQRRFSRVVKAPASSSRRPNTALSATAAAAIPSPHRRIWPSSRRRPPLAFGSLEA